MDSAVLVHSSLPVFLKELREKVYELPIYRKEWRSGERTIIVAGTEMVARFKKAQQGGERLYGQAIDYLAANIDTAISYSSRE